MGTGLSPQQWPPRIAMTVLSAGGERPRQGRARGAPAPPVSLCVAQKCSGCRGWGSGSPRAVRTPGDASQPRAKTHPAAQAWIRPCRPPAVL